LKKFLLKSKITLTSAIFIVICAFISVFAYVLAPDNSANANQMHVEIHSKAPGFKVQMLTIPGQSNGRQSWLGKVFYGVKNSGTEIPIASYQLLDNELKITTYAENTSLQQTKTISLNVFNDLNPMDFIATKTFHLGTDRYGRDLLSRLLVGTRISFFIGFIAVFISLLIGIAVGAVAGYFGGKIDTLAMWLINVTWSIPTLLLVIAITLALGKGFWQVFIAVGLTMWVEVARVVRGQVLSAKKMYYVQAAKALGFSNIEIMFRQILPNIMGPIIVIATANFAAAILIESGLSFLGVGVQLPTPSWGSMIKEHYNYMIVGKAYLAVAPGVAILLLVMSFVLIGNALRDFLDVKG